jgi:hypothetical protein
MNGAPAIQGLPAPDPFVKMAEDILAMARNGQIASIAAIIITANGGAATPHLGGRKGDMYVGAGMLQEDLMHEMRNPQAPPRIWRPGG